MRIVYTCIYYAAVFGRRLARLQLRARSGSIAVRTVFRYSCMQVSVEVNVNIVGILYYY